MIAYITLRYFGLHDKGCFWSQLVTVLWTKHELVSEPAWVSVLPKLSCELKRNLLWIITSWPLLLPGRISSPLSRGDWQVGLSCRWILVLNAFGSVQDRTVTSAQANTGSCSEAQPKTRQGWCQILEILLPGRQDLMASKIQRKRWEYKIKRLGSLVNKNKLLKFYLSLGSLEQWHTGQCHPASRVCAASFHGVERQLTWSWSI